MEDKLVVSASLACGKKAGLSTAPLDFESCVDMLGGDRAMVMSLLWEFLTNLDNQMKAISGALADADPGVLRKVAHSIKGGAAVLSAHPLMTVAAILEEIGQSGDLAKGEEGVLALTREAALLRCYCDELTKETG
jgi:HPt (histidine-containing phosphotransfer) domain-containing protein